MGRNFDLLVFDWDGTLSDSTAVIIGAIQAASRDLGLPEPSDLAVRQIIGLGLNQSLQGAVPELSDAQLPAMVERYRYHYFTKDLELTLFAGIFELLKALREGGATLAVATGKGRRGLNRGLEQSALTPFFAATRTADECPSKPHPQMLLELMDELKVAPQRTLMIGDTTHDLQLAKNAGVASVAVTYGAHSKDALTALKPLGCVDSVPELARWFAENG